MREQDDRAVEEVIGFVLTFSLIVAAVGLVSTVGYDQLERYRTAEQLNNVERGMQLVEHNMDELQQGRAVSRSSELELGGGSLTVRNESTVTVAATGTNFNTTVVTRSLQYELGDTTITYATGGVFRTPDRGNTVLVTRPRLTCSDRRAFVSLVSLNPVESRHIGSGVATVIGTTTSRQVLYPINRTDADSLSSTDRVNVTVTSPRATAWEQFFRDADGWTAVPSIEDKYACEGVDAVLVRRTSVNVTFGR